MIQIDFSYPISTGYTNCCYQFVIKSLFQSSEMAYLNHSSFYFHYSSSSIEKGYEVYRRYICAADSSFMNCFLPSHDFTRELVVILLSRVTTSLCLENTCIASCLANCICFLEDLNQKRLIINLPMPISLAADTNYTA